jgi:hypothetical protein
MKVLRAAGLVTVAIAALVLFGNAALWAGYRLEWAITGDYTHYAWYYYEWPYYHIIGVGVLVAIIGASIALLGDRHERRTD